MREQRLSSGGSLAITSVSFGSMGNRKKLVKTPVYGFCGFIIGYECKEKGIRLIECDKSQADAIIVPHHFSHKVTKNSCINLLVLYRGKISGAMQIGYGIRPHIKTERDGVLDYHKVREFDRMWLSDDMPRFSESICLSLLHHYLRATHKEIKYLISYADTSIGNTGTIYKAANYELIDTLKADFYVLPSGERIHPISMWHRHRTRTWEVISKIYPDIQKAEGCQLKFLKRL